VNEAARKLLEAERDRVLASLTKTKATRGAGAKGWDAEVGRLLAIVDALERTRAGDALGMIEAYLVDLGDGLGAIAGRLEALGVDAVRAERERSGCAHCGYVTPVTPS
jgi:hypothetical protein